jgi:hypothetical protein
MQERDKKDLRKSLELGKNSVGTSRNVEDYWMHGKCRSGSTQSLLLIDAGGVSHC